MSERLIAVVAVSSMGLLVGVALGDTVLSKPQSGVYSLRLAGIREAGASKLPSCGEEGVRAIESVSRVKVSFDSVKETAIVNGDEWLILKGRSGTFVAKRLTECTSLTLGLRSQDTKATGILAYVVRCSERPACTDIADYNGDFSRAP